MPERITLGLIQRPCSGRDAIEEAARAVDAAASDGANVIVLPELYHAPYFCQTLDVGATDLAEPLDGRSVSAMARIARERRVVVAVPFFERRAPGLAHNSMIVLGPDGERLGLYRKMHIPDDPQFEEKFYFTPGDLGFRPIATPHGKLGPLICWDQWFPEAARLQTLAGAQNLTLSDGDWLDPERKGRARRASARCMEDDAALSRHRQWRLRRGGQSGRRRVRR
ncbi:MAG: nitrilase-related carbon-nitrogen hydrolase [Polyangiaceae bacterium]